MWSDSSSDEEEEERAKKEACRRRLVAIIIAKRQQKEKGFKDHLNDAGRRRQSRGLCRIVLLSPEDSPWQKLYGSRDDQALITVTGFDHEAFQMLLEYFEPLFFEYTPWTGMNDGRTMKLRPRKKKGRPRIIKVHACLGLCLVWYRFRGAEFVLQGWFGFTSTHCNVWLLFSHRILYMALSKNDLARVRFPNNALIEKYNGGAERWCVNNRGALTIAIKVRWLRETTSSW